jgi:translation initiation factor 2B subunit (eIF-2B alpha/beta/delta family)
LLNDVFPLLPCVQAQKALQHQVQDVTSAQVASLSQDVGQLRQRQEVASAKMATDAAATRAQVAELRQWFDANQVRRTLTTQCSTTRSHTAPNACVMTLLLRLLRLLLLVVLSTG